MVHQAIWVGITVGVFFAGIGISYAVFSNTYDPVTMKFSNQELFDKMISQNPKMSAQWMESQTIKSSGTMMPEQKEKGMMLREQTRNQIGMRIQDPELNLQMQEMFLQDTESQNVEEIIATREFSDGIVVEIKSSVPRSGKFLDIKETFYDSIGNILEHVNHGIHVSQDGQTVLKMSDLHSHLGDATYYTRELKSNSPVEIEVTIHGLGMSEPMMEPINETITLTIPP